MYLTNISRNIWDMDSDLFMEEDDCEGAHNQIEMTYPLADRRVVEFLLQIPIAHFNAGGYYRGLIRKAMAGLLPEKIRMRTNKGYYSPGFYKIVRRDISKFKTSLISEELEGEIGKMIDKIKIDLIIEKFVKSNKLFTFARDEYIMLTISFWIKFSKSVGLKKKHEQSK